MSISANALRRARKQSGLSQQTVAERAGCSLSMVRLAEGGYRVSDTMAARILAAAQGDTSS